MTKTLFAVLKGEQSFPIREQIFQLFNTSGSQKAVAEEIISVYCYSIGVLSTNLRKVKSFRIIGVNSIVDLIKGYPESVMEVVFEIKEIEDAN